MKRAKRKPPMLRRRVRISDSLKRRREQQQRAEHQAAIPMPPDKPSLVLWSHEPLVFIAVCKYGYGVDPIPAMAIARAQTEIPARDRASQMLIYQSPTFVEPTGF